MYPSPAQAAVQNQLNLLFKSQVQTDRAIYACHSHLRLRSHWHHTPVWGYTWYRMAWHGIYPTKRCTTSPANVLCKPKLLVTAHVRTAATRTHASISLGRTNHHTTVTFTALATPSIQPSRFHLSIPSQLASPRLIHTTHLLIYSSMQSTRRSRKSGVPSRRRIQPVHTMRPESNLHSASERRIL